MKHFILVATVLLLNFAALATPTTLVVRAKAKDAKFIGSSIGGARIIIREAVSDRILAEGFTEGSTGNTERIMKQPHQRHQLLSDQETAAFVATLDLDKPTLLTIEGYAPWQYPQARINVQTQVWIIPGKHITGDGIVLEFPGLLVEIANPQTLETLSPEKEVLLTANIVMMCGCPLTKDGLWNAEEYEVQATIRNDGKELVSIPLHITSKANTFAAHFLPKEKGNFELTVYAYHPLTGNTGVAITHFSIK